MEFGILFQVAEVTNLDIQYEKCIWTNNGAFSEGGGMHTNVSDKLLLSSIS